MQGIHRPRKLLRIILFICDPLHMCSFASRRVILLRDPQITQIAINELRWKRGTNFPAASNSETQRRTRKTIDGKNR